MSRIFRVILILAAGALAAGVLWFLMSHEAVVCPFRLATGVPCPGCGGTRALSALWHGFFDGLAGSGGGFAGLWRALPAALWQNPLTVLTVALCGAAAAWWIFDARSFRDFLRRKWPLWLIWVVLCVVAANWIWNIWKMFVPLSPV